MNQAEIEHNFAYHAPDAEKQATHEKIRAEGLRFALIISELTRETPEQTLAIRCVEEATRLANAAVARYPHKEKP